MVNRHPYVSTLVGFGALALCLLGCGGGGGGGSSTGTTSDSAARLASLATSVGVLSPAFESGTTRYVVWTNVATTSVLLTPTPVAAGANITVDGAPPGVPIPVAGFGVGIDIVVTSPDGSLATTYVVEVVRIQTRDLIDPDPHESDRFGHSVAVLGNGNIVVTDPFDGTGILQAGAVHLYGPFSVVPFATVRGGAIAALMGFGGITVLPNDNFVVSSPGGVNSVGTVQLIDGTSGLRLGPALTAGLVDDFDNIQIRTQPNGNYVVATQREDVGGRIDAGAVRIFNGATGAQVGVPFAGDVAGDRMGSDGVFVLSNNNIVLLTPHDDENGIVNAGSTRLLNGTTGAQIGQGLVGETTDDVDSSRFVALGNGRFVVSAECYDVGGVVDAGIVRLFDATTGAPVGADLAGDTAGDRLANNGLLALQNNNFVIRSEHDDVGGVVDAGSVRLVSGVTGAQIGPTLAGDTTDDGIGGGRAVDLGNGNFAFSSRDDDVGAIVDAGSVRLVNGTTGAPVGAVLAGSEASDRLGSNGILALGNGNFVVLSSGDDVGGIVDAGSARVVDGTTGLQIGLTLAGNDAGDQLGGAFVLALANGNYIVARSGENEGGISQAGTARLGSGTSGGQIGPTVAGETAGDRLTNGGVVAVGSERFVLSSRSDDEGGVSDAGSIRFVSGVTGTPLLPILSGDTTGDMQSSRVVAPAHGGFFILGFPMWDNGSIDSGRVLVIAE